MRDNTLFCSHDPRTLLSCPRVLVGMSQPRSNLWCHDCQVGFAERDMKTHLRCLSIDCNWCRSYAQPAGEYRRIFEHQKEDPKQPWGFRFKCKAGQFCPTCRAWLIQLDRQARPILHNAPADCAQFLAAPWVPPVRAERPERPPLLIACNECKQEFTPSTLPNHKQFIPFDDQGAQRQLESDLLIVPRELVRLIVGYLSFVLPCENFIVCLGCGDPVPRAAATRDAVKSHYNTCKKVTICPCCCKVCDKDLFELHLLSSDRCRRHEKPITCHRCHVATTPRDLALHELRCPKLLTQCPQCKRKKIPQGELAQHMESQCPCRRK